MPSQLRSDTARANGAKSRGPKSAETKAISSQNALRHGFTSRHVFLLECENPDELKEMQDEYETIHHPATPAEQDLVDEMIVNRWRIRRIRTIETVTLECEMTRRKPEVEKEFIQPDSSVHMAMASNSLAEKSRATAHHSRHEA